MKQTILILCMIVFAASCSGGSESIKIGWIGPLSGPSAVLGIDSVVAAQMAVDEINLNGGVNGRPLELLIEDDGYDIANAVSAFHKLVDVEGVKVLLPHTFGSVFALAEEARIKGVTIIDPLDCNSLLTGLGEHVLCLATDSESIAHVLAEEAEKGGHSAVGILHFNSDTFMPLVKDVFVKDFEGTVSLVEGHPAGTVDFRTSLSKMISSKVTAIVLLGYDETGIAMKQARELGFTGQFFTTGTVTSPSLQEAAQGNAEGTIFAFWDAPKENEMTGRFVEEFIKRQGRPPILDLATFPTFDAVTVLAEAIRSAESEERSALGEALIALEPFEGVTGTIDFAPDGSMRIPEQAFELRQGRPVALD